MEQKYFGKTEDGREFNLYSFTNKNNVTMTVTELGATLVSVLVPDREGVLRDVVLGYRTPQDYLDNTCYFGAVIGRSGNRIARGSFAIDGKTYQMAINDNDNNLHSGPDGYDSRKWEIKEIDESGNSITFGLDSPDGDQGFPGHFQVTVTYTLTEDNEVVLHYEGVSDADTVANLTNHSYFNLSGHDSGTILDQVLTIYAENYTPGDDQSIPSGEIAPVEGTPMDFRTPKPIGRDIGEDFEQLKFGGGFDHNYALCEKPGDWKKMAEAFSEKTGIRLEAYTDCCGVQFYAGNFITEATGKEGAHYGKRQGFCLESQYYPNAINTPGFASPLLKAGEKYDTTTSYRFTVEK